MVDEDINLCAQALKDYPHDRERMEKLFNEKLQHYRHRIAGVTDGMEVISPYEENVRMTARFRRNIEILKDRLEEFRYCGYSNDLPEERKQRLYEFRTHMIDVFNESRKIIMEDNFSDGQKSHLLSLIDEIQDIFGNGESVNARWEKMRKFIFQTSGKERKVAAILLSILAEIAKEPNQY